MNMPEAKSELFLKGRREMSISGVEEMLEFDEESVRMKSADGELIIEGSEIKIGALDIDSGRVTLCGKINGIYYAVEPEREKKGFLGRLMR